MWWRGISPVFLLLRVCYLMLSILMTSDFHFISVKLVEDTSVGKMKILFNLHNQLK